MRRFLPALAALALAGCGYTGDPLPPLANVPERVQNIRAYQLGPRLVIEFAIPQRTTEGMAIEKPITLDLRAGPGETGQAEQWASAAKRIGSGTVNNGIAHFEAPAGDWTGTEILVGARVTGGNGKASNWSDFAFVRVVPPPETPLEIKATASPEGVQLTWTAKGVRFRVFRKPEQEQAFTAVASVSQPEWMDTNTDFGKRYDYRVQTITPLPAGREALSEVSEVATITPQDEFPPSAPKGLAASPAPASIELNWESNTEPFLGGYRVYRASAGGEFVRIAGGVDAPAYSDSKVEHGNTYRYAVTAVSKTGHESSRSAPVEVAFP